MTWVGPLVAGLVALVAAAAVFHLIAPKPLAEAVPEDGVVEMLTAAAYLAAAAFAAWLAVRGTQGRGWWGLLALAFLFVGGEEISWGQRLLGFEAPLGVRESNVQEELNLHNIEGLHQTNRMLGVAFFGGYFAVTPVAVGVSGALRALARRVRLPVPPRPLAAAVIAALALQAVPRLLGPEVWPLDEVAELVLGIAALAFAVAGAARGRR